MKKLVKIIILSLVLFCSLNRTLSYYNTNEIIINNFGSEKYSICLDGTGGSFSNDSVTIKDNKTILPTPDRKGYTFQGFSTSKDGNVNFSNVISNVDEINNLTLYSKWNTITYSISYNLNGGSINSSEVINNYNVESETFTLPNPTKKGYTFTGWTGSNGTTPTKNLKIDKGSIGDKSYTANWNKNYYKVNYYVNSNLWQQRSVGYNDRIENLNAQGALDIYHTFNGWTGWVDTMPDHDINLYANISEAYCSLITGHGPYGNASALLKVFQSAGWTGKIIEASTAPGNYMVVTDYTLTRAQADIQKNYIASHTNYTNYNFPYLYWVSVSCTNGISDVWTRNLGESNFH